MLNKQKTRLSEQEKSVVIRLLMLSLFIPGFGLLLGQISVIPLSVIGIVLLAVYALIDTYIIAKTKK